MITSKKLRFILGALCLTGCMMAAYGQSAVHPKSYYDAITYEWTDANNVTHTNAITEEATNPRQIVALLKKVYCDPRLPGPTYNGYDANGNRENEVYYGSQNGGWDISNSDVTAPYEDGYTLLMVSVKNNATAQPAGTYSNGVQLSNYTQLVNYFSENVSSVLLLTDGMRIGEGERAGTVFNISGYYNRFFMISKGQSRKKNSSNSSSYGEEPPFKQMFEELSPTTGSQGSETEKFYLKMLDGESYPVKHDCTSVISERHFFSMDGNSGTEYHSLTGLNIFIPDYRMKYFKDGSYDGRTMNPTGSTWKATYAYYNEDYAPEVGLYNIKLQAVPVKDETQEHMYNVNLTWTSSLDDMAHGTVPQHYIVYVVEPSEDGTPVYRMIGETDNTYFTDVVPQDEFSTSITYIVFGQPNDGEHDMFVAWSNDVTVMIPGWNDFLTLNVEHFESDYIMEQQRNYYRNFLTIQNQDVNNGLTTDRLAEENSFTLYRYDVVNPYGLTPILDLKLTANNWGNTVNYNISYSDYNSQVPTPGYNFNITTSGSLSVGEGNLINLSNIKLVDQFYASTEYDDQPNIYFYVLKLNSDNLDKQSNAAAVYVMKSNSTIKGVYTLDEVMNDVEGTLTPNIVNAELRMDLLNMPDVLHYTVERGKKVNVPNETVLKLQRNTDGTFEDMATETNYPSGEFFYTDNEVITGNPGDVMSYLPIIWLRGDNRVVNDGKENSYGAPIWRNGVGAVEVKIDGTRATTEYGEWYDENGEKCAIYNPIFNITGLLPVNANVGYEPYMYRVWRVCDDIRGYYVLSSDNKPHNWALQERDPHKLIVNKLTNETSFTVGSEMDDLAFGAKINTSIEFIVRFYYKRVGDKILRAGNEDSFYVVEVRVPWENIPTSVSELNTSGIVSQTYYNAQGIKSDKPFDGVNIVITRYSDGTTKTTKVVR